jgi:hypothetical protein
MSQMPHNNGDNAKSAMRSEATRRGNRTRRLNKANEPFAKLDAMAEEVYGRVDRGELERTTARVLIAILALRKDLELARDRRTEVIMKLEEVDVRAEFEELKRELGYSS